MIEIQVAGAGAGKTFGLSEKLINCACINNNSHKIIYAITYTNSAKRKISATILEKISNLFCPNNQAQENDSNKIGSISYITSNDDSFHNVIEQCKQSNKLIYIEKKQGIYETHRDYKRIHFPLTLEDKLRNLPKYSHLDIDLFLSSIILDLNEKLKKSTVKNILKEFEKEYISFDKYEYAEFKETLENYKNVSNSNYVVSSIDGVKGLESDICLFILNESMYKYLIKDIPKGNHNNKNWNKLYVALTRSSQSLILLIDKELFPNINLAVVENNFTKLNISKYIPDNSIS